MIFEIPRVPMGKQRPRFVRVGNFTRTYTPKETVNYENWVKLSYQNFGGENYGDEPLKVQITAKFPIPKSYSKKKHEQAIDGQIRPTIKPDCDNIAKVVCDALNGIAYTDDKQIVELIVRKEFDQLQQQLAEMKKENEYLKNGIKMCKSVENFDFVKENFKLTKQLAEKDKEIEVKIKFIIRLQKEIKNYRNKLYNFDLDTLKGKKVDKESYLKGFANCEQQFASQMIDIEKELRHQIYEKIREFCKVYGTEDDNGALTINIDKKLHTKDNLLDFLDQVEKGE